MSALKRREPPSQGWRSFLHNHAPDIAAKDLVPTIGFGLHYAFVIVRLGRRDLVWINVTAYPTADWVACQLTEAFPWNEAPRYMIRDRDRIYGTVVTRRLRAMGIRDRPTAPASPWQNGVAERLIGSIRRESVDHMIVLGEAHLGRILKSYARYYVGVRKHRSLNKDAPVSRSAQRGIRLVEHDRAKALASPCLNPPDAQKTQQSGLKFPDGLLVSMTNCLRSLHNSCVMEPRARYPCVTFFAGK
jgi:hypothetical protein